VYSTPIGNIQFDILDGTGAQVLLANINPGADISSITAKSIRLRATFTRTIPNENIKNVKSRVKIELGI
jgi:hypothetical protein